MSVVCDVASNAILGSAVEPICAVPWQGNYSLSSKSAPASYRDAYGHTVNNVAPVVVESSLCGLVKDEDDWNLGDISLARNADECANLQVDFIAMQT